MTHHTHTDRLAAAAVDMPQTQWQHGIEANAAAFLAEVVDMAKKHIETSNRSFGQMIRQHRERMERVMLEQENMGDEDLLCYGGMFGGG